MENNKEHIQISLRIKKLDALTGLGVIVLLLILFFILSIHSKTKTINENVPTVASTAQTILTFSPQLVRVTPNDRGVKTVNLLINTQNSSIYGADIELEYDPTVLQNVKVTSGSFLPQINVLNSKQLYPSPGRISYIVSIPPRHSAVKGYGVLLRLSFQPNILRLQQVKSSPINFAVDTQVSQLGYTMDGVQKAIGASVLYINQ